MDEGINKMWSIHNMDYYSARKNAEDALLSEVSQTPKTNTDTSAYMGSPELSDSQGRKQFRGGELGFDGGRVAAEEDEAVLDGVRRGPHDPVRVLKATEPCT